MVSFRALADLYEILWQFHSIRIFCLDYIAQRMCFTVNIYTLNLGIVEVMVSSIRWKTIGFANRSICWHKEQIYYNRLWGYYPVRKVLRWIGMPFNKGLNTFPIYLHIVLEYKTLSTLIFINYLRLWPVLPELFQQLLKHLSDKEM